MGVSTTHMLSTAHTMRIPGSALRRLCSSRATNLREVAPRSLPLNPTVTVTDNKSLGMPELAQLAVGTGMGRHRVAGHQFLHARLATDTLSLPLDPAACG